MKQNTPSLCPFQIGRALLREHQSLCTAEEYKFIEGSLRARNVQQLCSFTSSGRLSSARHCLFFDQLRALFSKNAEFCQNDANERAWTTFLKNEKNCRITSRRLTYYLFVQPHRLDPEIARSLYRAQRLISRWLGSFHDFLENLPKDVRTTGGATCRLPRSKTSSVEKISPRLRCSEGSVPLLRAFARYSNKPMAITICNYNRIAFVPKNYKTSRTIACEPDGVLPFQLACDAFIKRRLSRLGIDLSDQSRNQAISHNASIFDTCVTLDLANASDSLTIPVLEFLLPKPFFEFFMRLRSSHYRSIFGSGEYSKFASMGNGLTFPLETLVFSAVVASFGSNFFKDQVASVYGDDIIVPKSVAPDVIKVLRFIGFSLNLDKSYLTGPFRESCGKNSYQGIDVTPFYWRKPVKSRSDACLVINSLCKLFPYSQALGRIFSSYVKEKRLPLCPPSENYRSGIFVSVPTAYKLRLIRYDSSTGLSFVRTLAERPPRERTIRGSSSLRGFYYWLLSYSDITGNTSVASPLYGEERSVPRSLGDNINLKCYLQRSEWVIPRGHTSRWFNWLEDYIVDNNTL